VSELSDATVARFWPEPAAKCAARRNCAKDRPMLKRLHIRGFKSLADVSMDFPQLTVLFGPNAAGKSNVLDAVQALSRMGTLRTLSDALAEPIRGYPIEAFAFPAGGLPELLKSSLPRFDLEADVSVAKESYRYRIAVDIDPGSGRLSLADEYLAQLGKRGEARGRPAIERVVDHLHIRRKSKPAHPRHEPLGLNHSILSDPRLGGVEYRALERTRAELSGWKVYYLDPRIAMRQAQPPEAVTDIGVLGEHLAPFLYRLRAESRKDFDTVVRTLRALIPAVESADVDLDPKRGTLDIQVVQDGISFSSRVLSEGTLRVLALCAIAINPWGGPLIGFEEPENGVHPRRLELIAHLLWSLAHASASRGRQLILTTHSPLFCDALLRLQREHKTNGDFALLNVRREAGKTVVVPFVHVGPLFDDSEIAKALADASEEALFEKLLRRGLIDA
jgi:predicted ATPase